MRALTLLLTTLVLAACGRTSVDPAQQERAGTTDSALYQMVKGNNFAYYRGKDTLWSPAGNSPHGAFKLRFNRVALTALDASGKLPVGASFPDSSIVLKELYQNGVLNLTVPMLKLRGDTNAGNGWVWGEYLADGTLFYSVKNKGVGCIPCHTQTPNRDFIRSFDLH